MSTFGRTSGSRFGRPPGAARPSARCSRAAAASAAVAVAALAACSATPSVSNGNSDPSAPHTASLLADGRTQATLDVLTGTTTLTIRVAHFGPGGSLLRVTTPPGDQAARLQVTDAHGTAGPGENARVELSPNAPAVTVTLNADVSWQLNLGGGTTQTVADLRGGHVSGIAFTAGSSSISLALPRPSGSVTVRLAGGASEFLLSLPLGVPARVTAGGGAGDVSLLGQDHTGVAGGSAFTTPGWTPGVTGYDIDATSGASHIAVTAQANPVESPGPSPAAGS